MSILDPLGRRSALMVVSLFDEEENCFVRLPPTILVRNHKFESRSYQHLRSDRLAYQPT
jgi:hypothetical protein